MIPVTKPYLPSKKRVDELFNKVWESNWLTNHGPLSRELCDELKTRMKLENFLLVTNGTIALQIAIKALELKGEIITTPFSYVATTSSIAWEGCTPVFADIDPDDWNIDPARIRERITDNTCAILATHVFGNPCKVKEIEEIASEHNLKVIYDAAHCFDVIYDNRSILEYGDVSTISFHATKLFHTVEGGAINLKSEGAYKKAWYMHNFGHKDFESFHGIGINGKVSEFHAAIGLANLECMNEILSQRKQQHDWYDNSLNLEKVSKQRISSNTVWNYSYYPIVLESTEKLKEVQLALEEASIFPRRYFYPLLSELNYVEKVECPIAKSISSRILCLPVYHDLTEEEVIQISNIINTCL